MLFIFKKELQAGKFPLGSKQNPQPLDPHRIVERGGVESRKSLMNACLVCWSIKSMP